MSDPGRDHIDDLAEADRKVFEHSGYQRYSDQRAFQRSINAVFTANWRELMALLQGASTDPDLAIELIQNVREPTVRDQFQDQTTQRLHNYAAATMTLVDHSRRLLRDRNDHISQEFGVRLATTLDNPEVPFIQDLRNFMLHRSLPQLMHSLSMTNVNTPEAQMDSQVQLSTDELLEFKRWSPGSKGFLDAQAPALSLLPLITKHGQLVLSLNNWLFNALAADNASALVEVNELVVARNALLTGGSIEQARELTERGPSRWLDLPRPEEGE